MVVRIWVKSGVTTEGVMKKNKKSSELSRVKLGKRAGEKKKKGGGGNVLLHKLQTTQTCILYDQWNNE